MEAIQKDSAQKQPVALTIMQRKSKIASITTSNILEAVGNWWTQIIKSNKTCSMILKEDGGEDSHSRGVPAF